MRLESEWTREHEVSFFLLAHEGQWYEWTCMLRLFIWSSFVEFFSYFTKKIRSKQKTGLKSIRAHVNITASWFFCLRQSSCLLKKAIYNLCTTDNVINAERKSIRIRLKKKFHIYIEISFVFHQRISTLLFIYLYI